ncbi:MAG: GNAT family N-acetyltransferase [Rhodospirillales bacterium]
MDEVTIAEVAPGDLTALEAGLAEILQACVQARGSVGFILPFTLAEARAFWAEQVFPAVAAGDRLLWVARVGGGLAGTVQLQVALPPNQPHRAEVSKLLVAPAFRRRGIARALMLALETKAASSGKRLLTLDTRSGDAAEPLYGALGYRITGRVPGFCLDPEGQRYDSTTYMHKPLWSRAE